MAQISKEQVAHFAGVWGVSVDEATKLIKEQGHTIGGSAPKKEVAKKTTPPKDTKKDK